MNALRQLDDRLLSNVNTLARATSWLHAPLVDYARYGVVLFGVLLVTGLFVARRRSARKLAAAGWACAAVLVAVAVNQPIGRLFGEARPYAAHPTLLVLAGRTSDFSFPSDHAVMAGTVAGALLLVSRRLGVLAVGAALLMAFARVYIAAHYPWDVAAGLLLGAAVALLGWRVLAGPLTAFTVWLRRQPLFRPVFGEDPARADRGSVMPATTAS